MSLDLHSAVAAACGAARGGQHSMMFLLAVAAWWGTVALPWWAAPYLEADGFRGWVAHRFTGWQALAA